MMNKLTNKRITLLYLKLLKRSRAHGLHAIVSQSSRGESGCA